MMEDGKIIITNKDQLDPKHKNEHDPYEYLKYEVTPHSKENRSYVAFYEIPPQKANYPYHYHIDNEEIFYITKGSGIIETPDGDKAITAGDVIVCPPGEKAAHKIINTSKEEPLQYLDVDVIHSPDVVCYPHSDKIGVIINGISSSFFNEKDKADYYEGE